MPVEPSLASIRARQDLTSQQAQELMGFVMSGMASDDFIRDFLLGMNDKGVSAVELAAFADVLRQNSLTMSHDVPNLIDTCGTGGGKPSFNLSTAAAIVACAAGAKVAKHGNRAVTSKCGSADVLEHLGVRLTNDAEALAHVLDTVGMVFLFAQHHHPAMRHVGPVRKSLGTRTVFNLLGPLSNPAGAKRQLIGVYDRKHLDLLSDALVILGAERALVVHGVDGMDEISPCAMSEYRLVWDGSISQGFFDSPDVHESALEPSDTIAGNAEILIEAIGNANSPRAKAVWPNAGAALWLGGIADSYEEGVDLARTAIENGSAKRKLQHLIEETQAL